MTHMSAITNPELRRVFAYHERTKHHFGRFAPGPGYLDWATQPEPFRRYRGAPLIRLVEIAPGDAPQYEPSFRVGHVAPALLSLHSISQLFFDSLALSAWKRSGDVTWSLRVNPSSGNLHPTEGYLVSGPVEGLAGIPLVCHYAPREHALEVRAEFPLSIWQAMTAGLPERTILVGLTSVHWREAWKYGERAFRYCQLDVGHAVGAITLAAAGLGWQATLLDDVSSEQLAHLLGVADPQGAEAEHPDCLLAVYPQGQACDVQALPQQALASFSGLAWLGDPNLLSHGHAPWPMIDDVAAATSRSPAEGVYGRGLFAAEFAGSELAGPSPQSLRRIIHQRRSAASMDPHGSITRDAFFRTLNRTRARPGQFPFNALTWNPRVHLVLFVHRVRDLVPGLYLLVRDTLQRESLQMALEPGFLWVKAESCPPELEIYCLKPGDMQVVSRRLSCGQAIASDGCFSLGMLAEFEQPLQSLGPWFYRRLFWECGMIGQVLYLEAEATGIRGTGIGCFFDDPVHDLLGLGTRQFQSLYHFTVGHPVDDAQLATLPAYPGVG
jgi:SagB-type dehydrogenase family enzyme